MKKLTAVLVALVIAAMAMMSLAAADPVAPEGYPEIIQGLDFGGATVYIYNWWGGGDRAENPTESQQIQYDYWDWIESTYNVHVVQTTMEGYGWDSMGTAIADIVGSRDDSTLCIIAMDGQFAGNPMKNDMLAAWDYGLDEGDTLTQEFMTLKGVCYGTGWGTKSEPRIGVYFNKEILTGAGVNWNDIYAAQKNGTWTWAKMESYMTQVQEKYTSSQGEVYVWGLTGNGDEITMGLVVSNGAQFYKYNDSGALAPDIESPEMREALQRRKDWSRFIAPNESWDGYQRNWAGGKAAFMIGQGYEGFTPTGTVNTIDEWGFVAMPKGPEKDQYVTYVNNNVYAIPNVYDAATTRKLQQLFRLWTYELPQIGDVWSAGMEELTDEEGIATYGMLREQENGVVLLENLIGGRNTADREILWSIDGEDTVDDLIAGALPEFQDRCNEFNKGEQIEWELNEGVLTIRGTGKMKTHPWSSRIDEIEEVIIEEGVTSICEEAFNYAVNLKKVTIPYSVTRIDEFAFPDVCSKLTDVYYNGLKQDWDGGFVLPWGSDGNYALLRARVHCRATSPAGEQYAVTVSGVSKVADGETLTPGEDGFYTAMSNEQVMVSYSAPDMEGYRKEYRFQNPFWWDIPEEAYEGAGIEYDTTINVNSQSDDVSVEAWAIYFPEDPELPVLVSKTAVKFHVLHEQCGITVSGPAMFEPNAAGYPVTVTVPEGTRLENGRWGLECFRNGDEYEGGYYTNSNYEALELEPGENTLYIPPEYLEMGGIYYASFWFEGVGYDYYSGQISFGVIDMWLPEDLETVEEEAFAGNSEFHGVYIPDGCVTIGKKAFANCEGLQFVSYPAGTEIAADAFDGCTITPAGMVER